MFKKVFTLLSILALAVSIGLVGAGCKTTAAATTAAAETTAAAAEAETTTAAAETTAAAKPITITVWDQFTEEGTTAAGKAMVKLIGMYEEANPNIKIDRTLIPQAEIRDQVRLAIAGGTEPDIMYTWPAGGVLAGYVQDGALYDMTDKATEYGIVDAMNEQLMIECSYKGRIYGVPFEFDRPVVYYNTVIFDKLGLKEPTNFKEFENVLATAKAAGIQPMVLGNGDKWPMVNFYDDIRAEMVGRQASLDLFFGEAKWNEQRFVDVWNLILGWFDKGYFNKGLNGVTYPDSTNLFKQGGSALFVDGTWILEDLISTETADYKVGVFPLPLINEELKPTSLAGTGSQWQISAHSDPAVQEEAMKFVAYLTSKENAKIWIEEGSLLAPYKQTDWNAYPDINPVVKKAFQMNEGKEDAIWSHVSVPENVAEVLYNDFQLVATGDMTPEAALTEVQAEWEKAKASGRIWAPFAD
ncbi:MAG: ABC transporter substrate-binding protein [Candidatus Humimicrobiaceae bacterium]